MKKNHKIEVRVTKEEKEMIQEKAKKNNTTISSLVLNSIDKNITVNLDTSDYKSLVIQFRRIGNNINTTIRNINFSYFFTDNDMLDIKRSIEQLSRELKKESIEIKKTKKYLENLTPNKMKNILENENKRVPLYLIYDEIADHIILKMRSFIDLIEKSDLHKTYPSYIEYFLKHFIPTDFTYDELVDLSDDLENIFYKINHKVNTKTGHLTDQDIVDVMEVLKIHRKD